MRKRICLNMIVKSESAVIERCLASVRNHIDAWVIVDTGSTDDTKDKIRKSLAGIPGALHETARGATLAAIAARPWRWPTNLAAIIFCFSMPMMYCWPQTGLPSQNWMRTFTS